MELDPATPRKMHETIVRSRPGHENARHSWVIYPEAVAIGLVWAASMVAGIVALVGLLG